MFNVKVHISGDKETLEKIRQMKSTLMDWSTEFSSAGDMLKDYFENSVFETEGGIFQRRWAPLKKSYDFWKRVAFPGRGILERTGSMRHGWTKEVTPQKLELSNNASYAIFHQLGTRNMPSRPIIIVTDDVKNKIADIFKSGLARKLEVILK